MKLGFLTACFRDMSLEEIVKWAGANGFQALEFSATPIPEGVNSSSQLDVVGLNQEKAAHLQELCEKSGVEISCITYCDNNLEADLQKREAIHTHLRQVIDAAALLGVANVSTFVGRNGSKTIDENVEEGVAVFRELLAYAADRGVRIAIENWPGVGRTGEGQIGNIFMSPVIWERMFTALPFDNFGLNYDPSHLYWMGIDYIQAVRDFSDRIFHVHAKDTEILANKVAKGGILLPTHRWWRYRLPGLGSVDFPSFVSTLQENGYDYVISTEHEDPVWSGTTERVQKGLILGKRYLSIYVI